MAATFRAVSTLALFLAASVALAYEPYRVEGNVTRPEKISGAPPAYTDEAREARVEGAVILEAIIDEGGNVVNIRTLQGLPEGLNQAAMDAVETWKFKPATLDGRPVKVYYTLTVNFTIQNKVEGLSRVLGLLLNRNPELESLMRSKRLPEALAYLEGLPPTTETRAGRCLVLAGMLRFDEALSEARAYDGPDPDQLLQVVAMTAVQAVDNHLLAEQARAGILDAGIQAATEALGIRADYPQAMLTKSRLLREKAKLATDPQRVALQDEAEQLEKRAKALQ